MNLTLIRDMNDSAEFLAPTKKLRRLSVLLAIEHNPSISQHAIGKMTCLSSAMVNNYVKQLQREKLITMSGESNRTQTYHLTESGKSELSELLGLYAAELNALNSTARSKQPDAKKPNLTLANGRSQGEKAHGSGA